MSRGLPLNVKLCLDKALDSALLSVETYNKPAVKFKSGGYIVLMCIAWTSLFHAIFFKRGIKPFYREKNKVRFKRVDGEIQFWELATCVKEYFKGESRLGGGRRILRRDLLGPYIRAVERQGRNRHE